MFLYPKELLCSIDMQRQHYAAALQDNAKMLGT